MLCIIFGLRWREVICSAYPEVLKNWSVTGTLHPLSGLGRKLPWARISSILTHLSLSKPCLVLSMIVTLNQVIQGPLWDPDFLAGYLASWMLNIHSMNIGHLLNHSYFIKCRRRRQMEIPGVGRRRGTISSVSLLDYPHSQPPECQLCHFPMTLRCQSTLVFGYEQIWKRGLWGILRKWLLAELFEIISISFCGSIQY